MKLLTAREMQAVDRKAIDDLGIPMAELMENAGRAVADVVESLARERDAIEIGLVCGRGNNGGDGLVAARLLYARGFAPQVFLSGRQADLKSDIVREHAATLVELGVPVHEVTTATENRSSQLTSFVVIVDAIFGTGFRPPATGIGALLIEDIERARRNGASVVAVDLPSGLDADRGTWEGPAVAADVTVTFAAAKPAHFTSPADARCGRVVVAGIGIPRALVERPEHRIELVDAAVARALLPARVAAAHKGTHGRVLIVAGSRGKTGAAILAGRAALRSGSGLVTVATPASCQAIVASGCPELMTEGLAESASGAILPAAIDRVLELAAKMDVLAIGPGLGVGDGSRELARAVLAKTALSVVVDADALTALAGEPEASFGRLSPRVLTPHPGEASRLLGQSPEVINRDRMASAATLASRSGAVVVLKGHRTVTAAKDRFHINLSGNPGLATAGTGDVLTGVIAGLIAQGLDGEAAAILGVYLHGFAADRIVARRGAALLLASEVEAEIPAAIAALGSVADV